MDERRDPNERQQSGDPTHHDRRPATRTAVLVVAALAAALLALTPSSVSAGTGDAIPGGGHALPVGIGDFDGDGRQEAALIVPGRSTVVTVDVLTLHHEVRAVAGGGGPIGDAEPVGVADIDGDGRDDLVVTRSVAVDVWYRGLRNGGFGRGVVLGTGDSDNAIKAVGSLDGFTRPDIMSSLAPAGISGQPLRFRGVGGELAEILTDTGLARFMVAGRFEPDDREQLRLLVSDGGSGTSFVSFRKDGTSVGGFVLSDITWTLSQTRSVVAGDVDGDGLDDLVVQRTDGTVWVFANDGTGDFSVIRRVATADDLLTESTVIVGTTDIDGDGLDDVVAIDGSTPFRLWGDAVEGLVPERPASVRRCAGRPVTVEIAFGDEPTAGDDVILGTSGDDVIDTQGGNDVVCALGGDDVVRGGRGNDRLIGGRGNDAVLGGGGRDRLRGGPGDDRLVGGRGPDRLIGNRGDDTCVGGPGRDRLLRGC